ncbi:GFA family protein [Photobacterium kasasachensis]|uniref:GFA family protein n=1 Tax=Photobacterium kasasachensis TaxID=2910240 RepID=UPI003D0D176A
MKLQCHCGNIQITVKQLPKELGDCNCSICRRYKALWGYYTPDDVVVKGGEVSSYIWGDKDVEFKRCSHCGCITHYVSTTKCPEKIVAVNFRMAEEKVYQSVKIRKIDGASY